VTKGVVGARQRIVSVVGLFGQVHATNAQAEGYLAPGGCIGCSAASRMAFFSRVICAAKTTAYVAVEGLSGCQCGKGAARHKHLSIIVDDAGRHREGRENIHIYSDPRWGFFVGFLNPKGVSS